MTSTPESPPTPASTALCSLLNRLDRRRSAITVALVLVALLLQLLPEVLRPEARGVVKVSEATLESGHLRTIPLANDLPWLARQFWRLPDQRLDGSAEVILDADDGRRLGPGDAVHAEIAELGGGRYSVWSGWLYFSLPDPAIQELRWSGHASPQPWCRTFAALLLVIASFGTIMRSDRTTVRSPLTSPFGSIGLAMIALLPWALAVQPIVYSTDSACLLMWPRESIGHWSAVPCAWSELLQSILPMQWVGVAWIASSGALFAVSLGLLASLATSIAGRVAILAGIACVPLLPSIALGVLVDSATPAGGILAATAILLVDRIGRSRVSLAILAAAMLVLVSSRPLAFMILIAVPILPLLARDPSRPGWRHRLLEASKLGATAALFLLTSMSIQDATAHAAGAVTRSRPGRAASECLARMLWLDPSLEDWIRADHLDRATKAELIVLERASRLASGVSATSATRGASQMPGGVWPQVITVEARGVPPKQLEQAATNLYLHLITRRPDAMLRAQHLFLPDYAWPNESEDLDDLRRSIEQIFEEPLYARVHPAFASISDPGSRDGPMLIPAKAIAPLLAVLILIGTVGPRTIRGLVPVGPAFAALLGGSAYVASTIAAILFYKTTYLVAFTAVGAGVSIVIVACAIENALRSRRGIEKSRGVVERIEPVPPARGARG